jgi:hypothetical protein
MVNGFRKIAWASVFCFPFETGAYRHTVNAYVYLRLYVYIRLYVYVHVYVYVYVYVYIYMYVRKTKT